MQHTKPHRRLKRVSTKQLAFRDEIIASTLFAIALIGGGEMICYLGFLAKFVWHII